jgi:hypothetical protein
MEIRNKCESTKHEIQNRRLGAIVGQAHRLPWQPERLPYNHSDFPGTPKRYEVPPFGFRISQLG